MQRNTINKLKIDICDICLSQLVIHVVYIQLHQYHSSYRPIFQVNFISYNNKWEIFWVPGTGLDEEFVPPTVQRFECVWHCDIKHKNTTVSSPVERHTQRLKSLLSRCIPNLQKQQHIYHYRHIQLTKYFLYIDDVLLCVI